jgi:hypothetical protein
MDVVGHRLIGDGRVRLFSTQLAVPPEKGGKPPLARLTLRSGSTKSAMAANRYSFVEM